MKNIVGIEWNKYFIPKFGIEEKKSVFLISGVIWESSRGKTQIFFLLNYIGEMLIETSISVESTESNMELIVFSES